MLQHVARRTNLLNPDLTFRVNRKGLGKLGQILSVAIALFAGRTEPISHPIEHPGMNRGDVPDTGGVSRIERMSVKIPYGIVLAVREHAPLFCSAVLDGSNQRFEPMRDFTRRGGHMQRMTGTEELIAFIAQVQATESGHVLQLIIEGRNKISLALNSIRVSEHILAMPCDHP